MRNEKQTQALKQKIYRVCGWVVWFCFWGFLKYTFTIVTNRPNYRTVLRTEAKTTVKTFNCITCHKVLTEINRGSIKQIKCDVYAACIGYTPT